MLVIMPNKKVVGISKLARVIEIFAKRLQTQETMTAQIAQTIEETLKPHGVAIMIDAKHQCMTTRGIHKTECFNCNYSIFWLSFQIDTGVDALGLCNSQRGSFV